MGALFKEWKHDKQADILGYRDKSYRSTMTGTLAPPHRTPWMQAMDDSLEAFLNDSAAPAEKTPAAPPQPAVATAQPRPAQPPLPPSHAHHTRRHKQTA